jgi:hypothetical protein
MSNGFLAGYDTDTLIKSVLSRDVTKFGVSRVPFFFGSTLSTGISPKELVENEVIAPEKLTLRLPTGTFLTALRKMIKLRINPNQITITPYIRFAEARTNAGRIYYHWVDREGKAVDIYELTMSGQTGNLLPGNAESKQKLYLWMKLRELSYEPRVFDSSEKVVIGKEEVIDFETGTSEIKDITGETRTQKKNEFFIFVKTVSLPTLIMFTGFFKTPIVITERADSQYNHDWSITFGVENVYPKLETLSKTTMITLLPQLLGRIFRET